MVEKRFHNQLGTRLRVYYQARNQPIPSLRRLEKLTGVSYGVLHRWMRDEPIKMLDTETVVKLCAFLGCRLEELVSIR